MIISSSRLKALRRQIKRKIVFAGGTFDLMHLGHSKTCRNLRKYGDVVVVGVSTDKRVKERKGKLRPIQNEKVRVQLIDSLKGVDYAFVYPEKSKAQPIPTLKVLADLKPDVFVTYDKRWAKYRKKVEGEGGVRLVIEPHRIKADSTTSIINRIVKRYGSK